MTLRLTLFHGILNKNGPSRAIRELQKLNTHYKGNDSVKKDNLNAAIECHSQFPAEELVHKDWDFFTLFSHNGNRYEEESEVPEDGDFVLVEVSAHTFACSIAANELHSSVVLRVITPGMVPLGPYNNATV